MSSLRLSIEEVAFALAAVGGQDTAAGFLLTLIGERSAEDLSARLSAASHSLAARGLIERVGDSLETKLNAALRAIADAMISGADVVRVSVTSPGGERIITFFRYGQGAARHELAFGGVSELTQLDAESDVAAAIAALAMAEPVMPAPAALSAAGRVPVAQLHAARSAAAGASAADVAACLSNLPAPVAPLVAAMMVAPQAVWFTAARIITGEAGKAEADRAFFAASANGAGWLFDMTGGVPAGGDANAALVYPLAHETALAAAARLLAAPQSLN